jgi:hypothetical protein
MQLLGLKFAENDKKMWFYGLLSTIRSKEIVSRRRYCQSSKIERNSEWIIIKKLGNFDEFLEENFLFY